jgi:hypothetical protein
MVMTGMHNAIMQSNLKAWQSMSAMAWANYRTWQEPCHLLLTTCTAVRNSFSYTIHCQAHQQIHVHQAAVFVLVPPEHKIRLSYNFLPGTTTLLAAQTIPQSAWHKPPYNIWL